MNNELPRNKFFTDLRAANCIGCTFCSHLTITLHKEKKNEDKVAKKSPRKGHDLVVNLESRSFPLPPFRKTRCWSSKRSRGILVGFIADSEEKKILIGLGGQNFL